MHIAFLTPEYPHKKISHAAGIGTSIKNLAVALVKENCKVSIIVYGQNKSLVFEDEGVVIHVLEDRKYRFAKWYLHRKYIENYCNKLIKEQNITILEAAVIQRV